MTGRPTVFTENVLQKLDEAFALGCTDEEACIYADISPSSLYNHQRENLDFLERKQLLRYTPVLKARTEVVKGFIGNPNLALKYLERKKSDEFSLHTTAHIEVKEDKKPNFFDHPEMKPLLKAVDDKLKELMMRGE